jgi:ribokinase
LSDADRSSGAEVLDVLVVGSANLDLVARASRIPGPGETVGGHAYAEHPGGKGLNQAVAAARAGARTALIGAVGTDTAGDLLLGVMAEAGIDARAVARHAEVPTGRALIVVDDRAENAIVVVPGANAEVRVDTLPPASVVLLQFEVPMPTVVRAAQLARAAGATVVVNPAPAAELPDELVAAADVIVPNEHEVERAGGVPSLLRRGAGAVVVTRGAAGAEVVTAEGTVHQPAFPVEPVDTTAAGDTFCGALCARLAAGDPLTTAVRWAAAAAAITTTRPGAVPSIPHRTEIETRLAGTN